MGGDGWMVSAYSYVRHLWRSDTICMSIAKPLSVCVCMQCACVCKVKRQGTYFGFSDNWFSSPVQNPSVLIESVSNWVFEFILTQLWSAFQPIVVTALILSASSHFQDILQPIHGMPPTMNEPCPLHVAFSMYIMTKLLSHGSHEPSHNLCPRQSVLESL